MKKPPPGASPGTISVDPEAPRPVIHVTAYGPDKLEERDIEGPSAIRGLLGSFPVVWVNVDGLGDAGVLTALGEIFGIHPLALEDVVNVHQRAKVEQYGETLFIVARMASLTEALETEQISMFLGKGFVLTFQERQGDCLDPVRERIRKSKGRIRQAGADYLTYALLDAVVDNYFPILEGYGERMEDLEREAAEPSGETAARIHDVKRDLRNLRRAIWPHRESVGSLLRDGFEIVSDETRVYLRDCYDHTIQILDLVEGYREQGSDLMNMYMSGISNRMNEIMKVLTIIATIFIPLTFIAGIYGMNFNPEKSPLNMPELNWYWGYPFAICLMAASAIGLLLFFRRRKWL
jgi:magnesium transporter